MPNEDNPRVFDVSRPDRSAPPATSRPIIGGPPPPVGDPMISSTATATMTAPDMPQQTAGPTQIQVTDDSSQATEQNFAAMGIEGDISTQQPPNVAGAQQEPVPSHQPSTAPQDQAFGPPSPQTPVTDPGIIDKIDSHPLFSGEGQGYSPTAQPVTPTITPYHSKKHHFLAWFFIILLVAVIGGYLAVDSGLVRGASHLPFHIFKQKEPAATTPNSTPAASTQQTQTDTTIAAVQTYDDDFLSLKYPSTWTVVRSDNTSQTGTKNIQVYGPNDTDIASSTSVTKGHKASLTLNISKLAKASSPYNLKVYDSSPLTITQFPDAKLLITSDTKNGGDPTTSATYLYVSGDKNAAVGTAKLSMDLSLNSQTFNIWATVSDNSTPGMTISDLATFEKSQSVQDLGGILNSIQFK